MKVTVNGEERPYETPISVAELVAAVAGSRGGVAVAVDGEVVPRARWSESLLRGGETVEVLSARQGG